MDVEQQKKNPPKNKCIDQPEKLKGDAEVISEVEVLLHVDDIVKVVFVFPLDHIQDLQLN